jgi:hypothetical protein
LERTVFGQRAYREAPLIRHSRGLPALATRLRGLRLSS